MPLGEETEVYRVQFFEGQTLLAEYEVSTPELTLPEADVGTGDNVSIAHGSQAYGWGESIKTVL